MTDDLKKNIRNQFLNLLRNQKEEERLRKSLVILDKLFARPEFQNSKTILFYSSFDGEVETHEMMLQAQKLGKKIVLPVTIQEEKRIVPTLVENLNEDLEDGPYHIKQPKHVPEKALNLEELTLVLVPGVAFDKENFRLGRGGGYYDRFLNLLPSNIPCIGLGFDFQMTDRLPHFDHDIPVSAVITN